MSPRTTRTAPEPGAAGRSDGETLPALLQRIRACRLCAAHLPLGPRPVLRSRASARLLIVGQAPGTRVHASGIPWNDPSGERLRAWLGIDRDAFYDEARVAIVPMGFCYPGKGRSGDLPPLVTAVKPGSSVKLEVWRDGKPVELAATIGERESAKVADAGRPDAGQGKLGVVVRPLSPDEKEATKLAGGLVVEDVGGAAEKAGVRPGDVIVSANRIPVRNPADLKDVVGKARKAVALLIQRDDARIFVPVPLG